MTNEELSAVQQELSALQHLLSQPGWAYVRRMLEAQAAHEYNQAFASPDPHKMALRMGAHHAVKSLIAWPERQIAALLEVLKPPQT